MRAKQAAPPRWSAPRRSWDQVARNVVPEINGDITKLRESQRLLIENRAVFERAGQAVMAKITENDKAAAALPLTGPGGVAIPDRERAGFAEGSRETMQVCCAWPHADRNYLGRRCWRRAAAFHGGDKKVKNSLGLCR
jgi:hypothetical protein